MLPYVLVFTLVLFLAIKNNTKINIRWYYTVIVVFTLFAGFRDMIGGYDVYIYGDVYEASKSLILSFDDFEYGFKMLYLFLRNFSDDRYFMFFVVGMLFYVSQSYVLKKYSPFFYLSLYIIFCKFYLMSFVYLRQELAMALCWLAIPLIIAKNYIKFFGVIIMAFLMHSSALLFAPIYFIAHIKIPKLGILIIVFITFFVSLTPISDQLLILLVDQTEGLERVGRYQDASTGINLFYIIEVLLLLFVLLNFRDHFYSSKQKTVIGNGFLFYILITIFAIKNGAFIRFNWYFLIFIAIGLTYPLLEIKDLKKQNLIKIAILVYFGLLFFRLLVNWDGGDLMPYKTIFEDYNRDGLHDDMEYRLNKKTYGF